MSTLAPMRPGPAAPPAPGEGPRRNGWQVGASMALLMVATLAPLHRVYAEPGWIGPTVAAALLSLGIAAAAKALRAGPLLALLAALMGWAWFSALALFPETLVAGVVPTAQTLRAGLDAWRYGLELLALRPAPAVPETGLVLLTVTAIWAVGHAVHELVVRLHGPLRAVLLALVMWIVPLGLAPGTSDVWQWTVPFLAAGGLLLLATSGGEAARWGQWLALPRRGRAWLPAGLAGPLGVLLIVLAIVLGITAAPLLPGYRDPALYELRDLGGSTLTTNPIVSIRASLLSLDPRPVLRVSTARPVYLRTTSLDLYSDREEWTNDGIRGTPFRSGEPVPFEVPIGQSERVNVDITVAALDDAVLVPMPYQPVTVHGSVTGALQYDQRLSTFTLNRGVRLRGGDRYAVSAAVPAPLADQLQQVPAGWYQGALLDLPATVPAEVAQLARQIVDAAGAATPFEQALALQQELRSWTYSLDPPSGHSGAAMRTFLTNRIGYCEQFAGTMAVMLRTLGIPARIGVGFTPGEPVSAAAGSMDADAAEAAAADADYLVRASNAHAWVEVLFPGHGWIAFEPTPRSDGNVLVPSALNLAPSTLESQAFSEIPDAPAADPVPQQPTSAPSPTATARATTAPGDSGGGGLAWLASMLLAVVAIGVALAWRSGRVQVDALVPAAQVIHALAHVEAVSAALGRPRRDVETDREFLARITRADDAPVLAAHAERARYATVLPIDAMSEARRIAQELSERMLRPLDRRQRLRVRLRLWWSRRR